MKINEYLTVSQAAEYVGVCKGTIKKWDRCGKLHAGRNPINKYRVYLKEDLDKVMKGVMTSEDVKASLEFCDPNNKLGLYKKEDL